MVRRGGAWRQGFGDGDTLKTGVLKHMHLAHEVVRCLGGIIPIPERERVLEVVKIGNPGTLL